MLRHWSLYEALTHSRYIFTRLGLHGEHGRFKLDQWLARMGIPLEEAKQQYSYMKPQVREELQERMEQYGPENGLTELTYPSFRRVTNYSSTVSAADLVYCVNAQLEQRPPEPPKESAAAGGDEALRVADDAVEDCLEHRLLLLEVGDPRVVGERDHDLRELRSKRASLARMQASTSKSMGSASEIHVQESDGWPQRHSFELAHVRRRRSARLSAIAGRRGQ